MRPLHRKTISVLLALCFCVLLVPNVFGAASNSADAFISDVRDKMIAREPVITFTLEITQSELDGKYGGNIGRYIDTFYDDLFEGVFAHDGTLKGGDYLKKHTGESSLAGESMTCDGNTWHCPMKLSVDYYTTDTQEKALDDKLDRIFEDSGMDFDTMSDYQKICWAYDYITANVEYDYTHLNDDAYLLKYSAYAALLNGTAVCQGYSNLFYLMMQRLGVDCRIITGIGSGGAHAWNIVRIGTKYYNCDATWDAGLTDFAWFLRGSKTFDDHAPDSEFLSNTFTASYPISVKDYADSGETPAEPDTIIPGDADADGDVTAADARLALRCAVGLENYLPGSMEFTACNVDGDDEVTAADARLILRAAVGLEILK